MRHTAATTPALYTSVISGAMPRIRIIVVIVWMMKAPITVPAEGEAPAGERRAADHDGEDGVDLEEQPGAVGVGGGGVGCDHQPGQAGEHGAHDVHGPRDRARRNAGQARRLRVAADRLEQHAERGAAGQQGGEQRG